MMDKYMNFTENLKDSGAKKVKFLHIIFSRVEKCNEKKFGRTKNLKN